MDRRPIGVFDSGVGGLTVFKALEQALPRETMVYLGDTARVPYGTKSAETVTRYSIEAARFLRRYDVKMLVVACNTASALALAAIEQAAQVPVLGVIAPGARRAVEQSKTGRIGVIGTRATIASEAYPRAIQYLKPSASVVSRPCPLFVPLAEEGWTDNEVAYQVASSYLAAMHDAKIDTLVLGCTHYPLLKTVIAKAVGDSVALVDSADTVATDAATWIARHPESAAPVTSTPVQHHFFVTDAPEPFVAVAERFLGRRIGTLERARIEGE